MFVQRYARTADQVPKRRRSMHAQASRSALAHVAERKPAENAGSNGVETTVPKRVPFGPPSEIGLLTISPWRTESARVLGFGPRSAGGSGARAEAFRAAEVRGESGSPRSNALKIVPENERAESGRPRLVCVNYWGGGFRGPDFSSPSGTRIDYLAVNSRGPGILLPSATAEGAGQKKFAKFSHAETGVRSLRGPHLNALGVR
jgi:hypothetical protein